MSTSRSTEAALGAAAGLTPVDILPSACEAAAVPVVQFVNTLMSAVVIRKLAAGSSVWDHRGSTAAAMVLCRIGTHQPKHPYIAPCT